MTQTVFLLLILFGIKHFIADFVMQYPYMIREKGIYGATGGIHHSLVHASLTFIVLVLAGVTSTNGFIIIALSFADFVLHYHIDYFKQKLNRGLTTADRQFWINLGLDQALHYSTYIGIIYVITS